MPNNVSIFDLPHITESIGLHLGRKDLASCALVSQSFWAHFQPLLWRQLSYGRLLPRNSSVDMTADQREALIKNLRHTHRLIVHSRMRYEGLLALIASQCTSLRDLAACIFASQDDAGMAAFRDALKLLSANPLLRTLTMTAWEGILGPGNRRHLLNGIATSPRLTEMNLKLSFNPPTGWLHRVLQSLPPTIKVVRCQWGRVIDNGSSVAASEERAIQLARQQSPKEYPYLVYADLKIFLAYGEEDDLITFVKHCPSLKAMNIPRPTNGDVLTRLIQRMEEMPFPRNSRVSFNTGAVTQIRDTHWRRLLLSLSDHIQGFATRLPFNSSFARGYISAMTSSWSHLLETIEIDQAQQITSSDIQVILTTCPKLKKLDCLFPWIGTMFGEGDDFTEEGWESFPGLEAMVRDDDKGEPLAMVDWVCTDLEELSLTFADGRRLEVDDDTLSKQEKWTERGIQHIYNQLGRLSKLQYLAIGWSTSAIFSDYANLNMSLKSGLHHLSGLDELKVLDLNHLCEIHINSPEVDWILEHWPNLTKLRGIDFRVEQPWPEHLTRLWTKPNMIIE